MAASSIAYLDVTAARFPTTNFGRLFNDAQAVAYIAFDASTAQTCYWVVTAPQGLTGTLQLVVYFRMTSATSGKVDFVAAVEAVTPGDAFDTDAGQSFDTDNAISPQGVTVPATAGYESSFTIVLTNADTYAAGDKLRIRLTRDATDATNDTATGDCHVTAVELQKQ